MLSAFIWFIIIGCLIKLAVDSIIGFPDFIKKLRLKYEEEKWRKQREKAYSERIEREKCFNSSVIYQMQKENNPYRKDFYYLFKPEDREFFNSSNSWFNT